MCVRTTLVISVLGYRLYKGSCEQAPVSSDGQDTYPIYEACNTDLLLQVLYLGGSVYKHQSFLKGQQLFLCTKAETSETPLALLQTIMVKDISLSYFS
jgi:hypothetical protein